MTALQKAEQRRLHQDQIHQCNMNKLTQDMALLQQEYRLRIEDYKRRSEMEEREVEKEYLRKMEVLEAKVMEEKANVSDVIKIFEKYKFQVTCLQDVVTTSVCFCFKH